VLESVLDDLEGDAPGEGLAGAFNEIDGCLHSRQPVPTRARWSRGGREEGSSGIGQVSILGQPGTNGEKPYFEVGERCKWILSVGLG